VTDLRLVPAAMVAWLGAALLVAAPAATAGTVAVTLLVGALVGALVGIGQVRRLSHGQASHSPAPCDHATSAERVATRLRGAARGHGVLVLVALAAVAFSTAGQLALREAGPLDALVEDRAVVTLEGVVRSEPRPLATGPGYRVELAARAVSGRGTVGGAASRVLVLGGEEWHAVRYGERVRLTGRLGPADPGDAVAALTRALGPPDVTSPAPAVDRAVTALRSGLLRTTEDLSPDARGLVPGLALGDTSRLDPELAQAMRDVSLTHITAVSGAHFAIIGAAVLGLVTVLGVPRTGRVAAVVVVTVGFVLLVHPEPSVLRAATMGTIGALALLLGRPSAAMPALAATVLGLLVVDPWLARSYGFVLSALATAGLVLLARPTAGRLGAWLPDWLAHAVAVPFAAQLACAPVLVLLAPVVSLYAVPANLLAAPALVPGTVLGVLATLVGPWWPWGSGALATGAGWACSWIAGVARVTAALPGAVVPWPGGPGGAALLAALTLGAGLLVVYRRRLPGATWRITLVLALCLMLAGSPPGRRVALELWPDGWPPPGWRAVLCDVGQGTALVVRSGERSAVVVDTGPADGGAGACLDRLGVRRIDLLVLSHFHADHVEGLPGVLAGREVSGALVSPLAEPGPQAATALAALERRRIPVREGRTGMAGAAGDVAWRVLWPDGVPPGAGPNDASVVVWLAAGDVTLLALGDLETSGQDALARDLAARGVRTPAQFVVMAHHGSAKQSAALATLLDAPVALVGVGADNSYGHPAPSALELYGSSVVLRTDQCGDIALTPTHHSPCRAGSG